jgi:hypothetical protein
VSVMGHIIARGARVGIRELCLSLLQQVAICPERIVAQSAYRPARSIASTAINNGGRGCNSRIFNFNRKTSTNVANQFK